MHVGIQPSQDAPVTVTTINVPDPGMKHHQGLTSGTQADRSLLRHWRRRLTSYLLGHESAGIVDVGDDVIDIASATWSISTGVQFAANAARRRASCSTAASQPTTQPRR